MHLDSRGRHSCVGCSCSHAVSLLLVLGCIGGAVSPTRAVHAAEAEGTQVAQLRMGPHVEEGVILMKAPEYAADGLDWAVGERTAAGLDLNFDGGAMEVSTFSLRISLTRERLDFDDYMRPQERHKSKGVACSPVILLRAGEGSNWRLIAGGYAEAAIVEGSIRMNYPGSESEVLLHAQRWFSAGGSSGVSWTPSGGELSIEVLGSVAHRLWDSEIKGDRSGASASTLAITAGAASITWAPLQGERERRAR
jgi:hypothetical protein